MNDYMTGDRNVRPVAERPAAARMFLRSATRRCAVCGSGNLFTGWFRMRDHCPRCGYVFAREEGFSLGAILMNFAVTELLLGVFGIVPLIVVLAANPDANVTPVILGGVLAVVAGPFLFYPFSRTLWVAIELMLRPAAACEPDDRR
jgi:uncharacterized protein (DUF983 family)